LGIAACGTKVAAFSPLTVLSIVGGNVLIQKPSSDMDSKYYKGSIFG
jgi:hypothetical protein